MSTHIILPLRINSSQLYPVWGNANLLPKTINVTKYSHCLMDEGDIQIKLAPL